MRSLKLILAVAVIFTLAGAAQAAPIAYTQIGYTLTGAHTGVPNYYDSGNELSDNVLPINPAASAGTSPSYDSGPWVGWSFTAPFMEFDLDTVNDLAYNLTSVTIRYQSGGEAGVNKPGTLSVYYSFDQGSSFSGSPDVTYSPFESGTKVYDNGPAETWYDTVALGGSGVTHVRLVFTQTSQWTMFSEVTFDGTEIPEPATLGLLLAGGVGVLVRKRRRS